MRSIPLHGQDVVPRSNGSCLKRHRSIYLGESTIVQSFLNLSSLDVTDSVHFTYTRFDQQSADWQRNYVSNGWRGRAVNTKMPSGTILADQHNVISHRSPPLHASRVAAQAPETEITPNQSKLFSHVEIAEIGLAGSHIMRQTVQFVRDTMQQLFEVLLNGHCRQPPGVVGLLAIVG